MRGALNNTTPDHSAGRPGWTQRWSQFDIDALRRACFCRLAREDSVTSRFGVSIDQIVEQVVGAKRRSSAMARRPERLHLDDAALAAACVSGDGSAWAHLVDQHEPGLVAAAELHVDARCSLVTVRRLFSILHKESRLRQYAADMPLQSWLIEQLMAHLGVKAPITRSETSTGVDPRTMLAMKLLGESRGSIRRSAESSEQGADKTGT